LDYLSLVEPALVQVVALAVSMLAQGLVSAAVSMPVVPQAASSDTPAQVLAVVAQVPVAAVSTLEAVHSLMTFLVQH
jgi:hypothetical protein